MRLQWWSRTPKVEVVGASQDELGPTLPAKARTELATGPEGFDDQLLRDELRARMFGTPRSPGAIGRYSVVRKLGRGGMGVVYEAHDPELDRTVAIKVLLAGAAISGRKIQREARAMARLSHPNVAAVHEVGTYEGRVYLAMEHVQGETLRKWLAADRPGAERIDRLLQAARGLQAAHEAGLVHRDFKPDNVMVGSDGRVRVLDFGLARSSDEETTETEPAHGIPATVAMTTRTGDLLGTPAYMAAEQFLGEEVDARTDQYALCVTIFEALYGHRPFSGDASEVFGAVVRGDPPEFPRRPAIPAQLRRALEIGLRRDPAARHPDLGELLSALGSAASGDGGPSRTRWLRFAAVMSLMAVTLGLMAFGFGRLFLLRDPDQNQMQSSMELEVAFGPDVGQAAAAGPQCDPLPTSGHPPDVIDRQITQLRRLAKSMKSGDPDYPDVLRRMAAAELERGQPNKACMALKGALRVAADADRPRFQCLRDRYCSGDLTPVPDAKPCPPGTEYDDTQGCKAADACDHDTELTAMQQCEGDGPAKCCIIEGIKNEFEFLEHQKTGDVRAEEFRRKTIAVYERACEKGDAPACSLAADLMVKTDDSARPQARVLLERACALHQSTACGGLKWMADDDPAP